MQRKTEIALALGVVIALILLILFLVLNRRQAVLPDTAPQNNLPSTSQATPSTTLTPTQLAQVPEPQAVSAQTIARTFAERIGSYSSEADFANLDDVAALGTAKLQAKIENMKATTVLGESYYGISTTILGLDEISSTETTQVINVRTQRQEAVGSPGNVAVRYQTLEVTLLFDGTGWLVDDFVWLAE
ncbi:hypothetical protein KBC55_04280 [Patescibacteria group bacterium]|nr:hypothetical protein [Patescibacteria group bacterium]